MDNVQALKNLYEQLGGNPADVADISTNADMINAIAGLDIGGGGGTANALRKISDYARFTTGATSGTEATTTLTEQLQRNKMYLVYAAYNAIATFTPVWFNDLDIMNGIYVPLFDRGSATTKGSVVANGATSTEVTFRIYTPSTLEKNVAVAIFAVD